MGYETALSRTAAMCSTSEHCIHELREKMTRWGVEEDDIDRVIDYLVDEKYVDESRFCRAYANDKLRYNHWGRIKISQMLYAMHLGKDDIAQGLDSINEDEYTTILNDVLTQKAKGIKADSDYERNGKLIRFALGRGFEMDLILKALHAEDFEY